MIFSKTNIQFVLRIPKIRCSIVWPGGGERVRTDGLLRARQALSQLSYTPVSGVRGQGTEVSC